MSDKSPEEIAREEEANATEINRMMSEVTPEELEEALRNAKDGRATIGVKAGDLTVEDRPIDPADIQVEAEVSPPTEEELERERIRRAVYKCNAGHEQHGPNLQVVKSHLTNQIIAVGGTVQRGVCVACFAYWLAQKFPTFPKKDPILSKRGKSKAERKS
jgi:hypothetical protein